MLSIKLREPRLSDPQSSEYEQVITHLATHTLMGQGNPESLLEGYNAIALDISQVCCWLSEKPLNNGMRLCTMHSDQGLVALVAEPGESVEEGNEEDGEMVRDKSYVVSIGESGGVENCLLLCGDTAAGLQMSLGDDDYLSYIVDEQGNPVENPRSQIHYLWPQKAKTVNVPDGNGGTLERTYTPDQYFVYVRKMGIIEYGSTAADEDEELENEVPSPFTGDRTELAQQIFIEPNPKLPKALWYKARNTIRLFRLNGNNYVPGKDYHQLQINSAKAETLYDDMRLTGRHKAYDRAHTALSQLKAIRTLNAGPDVEKMIVSQQQILIELNGYRSVWRTVFKEGGDEGGFNQISMIPSPVGPPPETISAMEEEVDPLIREKDEPLNIADKELMNNALEKESTKMSQDHSSDFDDFSSDDEGYFDTEFLYSDLNDIANDDTKWEKAEFYGLKRIKVENEGELVEKIVGSYRNQKGKEVTESQKAMLRNRMKKKRFLKAVRKGDRRR
ncbi:MAG: hypothetical protein AAFQ98_14040 [Bacteroidota bacterium]